jgi:hypothetical protein
MLKWISKENVAKLIKKYDKSNCTNVIFTLRFTTFLYISTPFFVIHQTFYNTSLKLVVDLDIKGLNLCNEQHYKSRKLHNISRLGQKDLPCTGIKGQVLLEHLHQLLWIALWIALYIALWKSSKNYRAYYVVPNQHYSIRLWKF